MQHSSFRFRYSTFHKQQTSFRIRPSSSVGGTFTFSHPTFSICPLSFRFPHPTLGIVLASFRSRHSTFRIELLPAGLRPMEIVGSIDLTHPRSNGGRESVERLSGGVDSGDFLHRVIKAADRQDAVACCVRVTLLRVADCLSTLEETPSSSKYRATLVKYEEVMCSIKFVFAPTQAYMYG